VRPTGLYGLPAFHHFHVSGFLFKATHFNPLNKGLKRGFKEKKSLIDCDLCTHHIAWGEGILNAKKEERANNLKKATPGTTTNVNDPP